MGNNSNLLLALAFCLLFPCLLSAQDTLRVDVNLVNVFATVQNERGEFVTGLTRDDFRIYDDNELQEIRVFENQDRVDSSIGLLMDTSGSMVDILPYMKTGIRDFTRGLRRADEFFVVSFGTNVNLIHTSSQPQKHLEDSMAKMRAYGTSLMYDALLYGMQKVERSDLPRKALVVFTDGNDNGSNDGHGRVVEEAQRAAVLLYFVAIGPRVLIDSLTIESLSGLTGGRTLYVGKQEAVSSALDQIRTELSRQYYIGYYVPRRPGNHHIRVEVPDQNVKIRAKTGYTSAN